MVSVLKMTPTKLRYIVVGKIYGNLIEDWQLRREISNVLLIIYVLFFSTYSYLLVDAFEKGECGVIFSVDISYLTSNNAREDIFL